MTFSNCPLQTDPNDKLKINTENPQSQLVCTSSNIHQKPAGSLMNVSKHILSPPIFHTASSGHKNPFVGTHTAKHSAPSLRFLLCAAAQNIVEWGMVESVRIKLRSHEVLKVAT
jgi:hypothetical protein